MAGRGNPGESDENSTEKNINNIHEHMCIYMAMLALSLPREVDGVLHGQERRRTERGKKEAGGGGKRVVSASPVRSDTRVLGHG